MMGKYMFLLLVLLGTCGCSSSSHWGGCPPEERSALLIFKQGLADPYDLLISWKGSYCCSWKGITCHRISGHVIRLDLSTFYPLSAAVRNSSSQIFPALFQLHHLEYLDLSEIDLFPLPFPSHLPSLTKLTHLSFYYCRLNGQIPSEIGNMSSLEFLDISFNPDLTGQIPSELGNLSRLEYLDISGNDNLESRQSGSWIRNLRGLEELYMYDLNVGGDGDGVLENVASLTKLTSLAMSGASGTTLSSLVNLTSLSHLYLLDSDLAHQPFPIWISNLTSLVALDLYNYSLHGSIPSTVLGFPHLKNLGLSYNPNLKVNVSSIVQYASQLRSLYIDHSNVGGGIPNSIGNISSLTALDLSKNKIESIIPSVIGNMSSLTHMDLSQNKIKSIIPPTIGIISLLDQLDLSYNKIQGITPLAIGKLSSLTLLDLSCNKIEGIIPSAIGKLSSLTLLDLSYNSLRDNIPWSSLCGLSKLLAIHLMSNQLNGSFPSTIINLSFLENLYLTIII